MDGFLIRGWEMVLPGCGGTSILSREATIGARWLHEPQPISNQSVRWGLYAARGGIDPGDICFRPRVVQVVEIWRDFSSEDTTLSSPGAAGPRRWPEG